LGTAFCLPGTGTAQQVNQDLFNQRTDIGDENLDPITRRVTQLRRDLTAQVLGTLQDRFNRILEVVENLPNTDDLRGLPEQFREDVFERLRELQDEVMDRVRQLTGETPDGNEAIPRNSSANRSNRAPENSIAPESVPTQQPALNNSGGYPENPFSSQTLPESGDRPTSVSEEELMLRNSVQQLSREVLDFVEADLPRREQSNITNGEGILPGARVSGQTVGRNRDLEDFSNSSPQTLRTSRPASIPARPSLDDAAQQQDFRNTIDQRMREFEQIYQQRLQENRQSAPVARNGGRESVVSEMPATRASVYGDPNSTASTPRFSYDEQRTATRQQASNETFDPRDNRVWFSDGSSRPIGRQNDNLTTQL
jgi:hypothetical protein